MLRIARMIGLAAVVSASTGIATAQTDHDHAHAEPADKTVATSELPGGWDVLDRAVEAGGGVDAYMKIKNFVAKGGFSMPAMGVEGSIERTQSAPGNLFMHIDLGPMGEVIQATDGETVWGLQPGMTEPVIMKGEQAEEMIANARFYDRVHPRDEYESAEVVGVEDVDGTSCYRVNLEDKTGKNAVSFYSVESGHQIRTMSRSNPEAEAFDVIIELSDFREVDGLVHAFVMKQTIQGNEFTITFDSFEHDVTIDDSIFAPPAEETPEIPEGEI
ncbi:MAG: hypothetical protein ACI89L_002634 [Phycisphaerales bacterium]|jgi:uncharacterized protein (UPF0548 family)